MPRTLKTLAQMNADALEYLSENTEVTYLSEGSIARALVEATNVEISNLQEYIASTYSNVFINSATGPFLDLLGEQLGVKRLGGGAASTSAEDQNVKFSVTTGRLGDFFQDPGDSNKGLISGGLTVSTADSSVSYQVAEDVRFNRNLREVFVPVLADNAGAASNVGRNKLVSHSGSSAVNVTNLKTINNGRDIETDREYRFRLANQIAASPSANEIAIRLAVIGNADISSVELREFARGAGTFDALLVPVRNTLSRRTKEVVQNAINSTSAFGISGRALDPTYVTFRISVQLIPLEDAPAGVLDSNRINAKNAILDHFEGIPIGGELVINRLRADIVNAITQEVRDIRILELCVDGRPHSIRNIKLRPDELFTPALSTDTQAIEVL